MPEMLGRQLKHLTTSKPVTVREQRARTSWVVQIVMECFSGRNRNIRARYMNQR